MAAPLYSCEHKMRWVFYPLVALAALAALTMATAAAIAFLAWPKLPSLEALTDYQPRIPLRVYTADGYLISEFGEERRSLVKIQEVPETLRQAILAAEDEHFYAHMGVDPVGLTRAALANFRSGGHSQGASTITMQVARNFFLTREKSYNRKLYEILLSFKIEQNLSKDQIFELYINQIFLGQRAYGFAVAAQTYFGKQLGELTLAEAAMLAGLPQAPSKINPITNPARAQQRQRYVLRRMVEAGFINDALYQQALTEPLTTTGGSAARAPEITNPVHADYVAEMARQIAVDKFGDQAYELGITIITTIHRDEQEAAYEALRRGVMDYDRRHGYRGPERFITLPDDATRDEVIADTIAEVGDFGDLYAAVVLNVRTAPPAVEVYRNGQTIRISGDGLKFATPMLSETAPQTRRIRRGAVVRIRNDGDKGWALTQLPDVQSALLSIDAQNGEVRALVGGFDFNLNKFNHVTQAQRQPGSSFKPFIYSASLEKGLAPGLLLPDEPLTYPAGVTGSKTWSPHNSDGKFDGWMTMRDALAKSKNVVAVRVLERITPAYVQDYIGRFGFDSASHPPYLTMALGAGSVTPWEMATAYAVFANGGYRITPYVIKEIRDNTDQVIARADPPFAGESAPRVIDPRNAWIMNTMLQDVTRRGTAARSRVLNRSDIAGKTGTTNDYVDAWFCGYTPDIVAVVWTGFSRPHNMGRGETGSSASLPTWINYMRPTLNGLPERALPRPPGIKSAPVADESGRQDFYYAENEPPELPEDYVLDPFLLPGAAGDHRDAPQPPLPPALPAPLTPAPVEERILPPLRPLRP
ncbi:penicillin-binding protein 1A [Betaproteobacteria bacterium]|nr:penicillin-binding protein 1A [Betaproteobacteria bacterium]GHU17339.1 penicillin-binding protein 1A [Betaproteobacteria bacterium]